MDDPERFPDGSDVKALVRHYKEQVPAWWVGHRALLKGLQTVHDDEQNWFGESWHIGRLAHALRQFASEHGLKNDAVLQVATRAWTEVEV
jgi:hypothetical protein